MEKALFDLLLGAGVGDIALTVIAIVLAWGTPRVVKIFMKIERRLTKLETAFEMHMEGVKKNVELGF